MLYTESFHVTSRPGCLPLHDGASPAALFRVVGGVDVTLQSVDKEGQSFLFVLTETLRHRHHAYHVTLKT